MKLFWAVFGLVILSTTLFSQEYVKDARVNFKDKSIVEGDFYYYPYNPTHVMVEDGKGKRKYFEVSEIDFIEGKNSLVRNIPYKGTDKLFECVVEGKKISLYKTFENEELKLYVLKDNQLLWLESGKKEVEHNWVRYSKDIYTYRGILKYLMNDKAELSKKVDRITCTEKEVAELVLAYNEGNITYFNNIDTKKIGSTPDWKIYSSYSNYAIAPAFFALPQEGTFGQFGAEYFFSEGSRHSFRFGFEYGNFLYKYQGGYIKSLNFNLNYNVDYYRSPNCNLYMNVRFAQVGKTWAKSESEWLAVPQLYPGLGAEYRLIDKLEVFGEINNILIIKNLPHNIKIGITYDI